jgi:hypothetical protein
MKFNRRDLVLLLALYESLVISIVCPTTSFAGGKPSASDSFVGLHVWGKVTYRIHLASFFIMEKIKQRENGNVLK